MQARLSVPKHPHCTQVTQQLKNLVPTGSSATSNIEDCSRSSGNEWRQPPGMGYQHEVPHSCGTSRRGSSSAAWGIKGVLSLLGTGLQRPPALCACPMASGCGLPNVIINCYYYDGAQR